MISVVIRTKNEEAWIERCLAAVYAQACDDFEVVVVDNESTDRTKEVVAAYQCRVVSISDKDFSFGRSLNWGIETAIGGSIGTAISIFSTR